MKIQHDEAVNAARIGQVQGARGASNQSVLDIDTNTGAADGASPAATVQFSDAARDIANAKAAVSDSPDVREDLVQSLKARIANGTYNVKGEDVADMMMRRYDADNSAND